MGLVGFTLTLAREGVKYNIKSTAIAPVCRFTREKEFRLTHRDIFQVAASGMTETVMPPEMLANLSVRFSSGSPVKKL